jgi:hypothetical protein
MSSYCHICVLILLYLCPHAAIFVLILLYLCPHTAIYVSSNCYMCVLMLLYMCPHACARSPVPSCPSKNTAICVYRKNTEKILLCVLMLLYMCPHACARSPVPSCPSAFAPHTHACPRSCRLVSAYLRTYETHALK